MSRSEPEDDDGLQALRNLRQRAQRKALAAVAAQDAFVHRATWREARIDLGGSTALPEPQPHAEWFATSAPAVEPAELRPTILAAARKLFAQNDFRNIPVREVAQLAHVGLPRLQDLFPTKEQLLIAVVEESLSAFEREANERMQAVAGGEPLSALAEFSFSYLTADPLLLHLMLGTLPERSAWLAQKCEELRERGRKVVAGALELGVRQGIFRSDLDTAAAARLLLELHLSGYLFAPPSADAAAHRQVRRETSMDLLLRGMLAR